ncbi:hypothetical protein L873DRAFT_1247317 [Choiromyces venosus 120613-1]|uniref:Uncharacterized protein n=1 Tax=Choiromyces venosus 120613-1 TaxID=1336337 RepID=A0A3N4JCY3_9PEZI|nr:hypothetical protein L873DRAFT_1247317 [Choiromyces venosus 120613-1]
MGKKAWEGSFFVLPNFFMVEITLGVGWWYNSGWCALPKSGLHTTFTNCSGIESPPSPVVASQGRIPELIDGGYYINIFFIKKMSKHQGYGKETIPQISTKRGNKKKIIQ